MVYSIGNLAHIHFAANIFSLPLKSEDHPRGIYTEHEMYQLMALMFICIFFDLDPVKSFPLRMAAKKLVGQLSKVVEANVRAVNMTGWIAGIVDGKMQNKHHLTDYGVHMVRQLLATGMNVEQVTYSQIMPTAGAMVANQAQVVRRPLEIREPLLTPSSLLKHSTSTCRTRAGNICQISTDWRRKTRKRLTTRSCTTLWKAFVCYFPWFLSSY
jgi:hypothetical protein